MFQSLSSALEAISEKLEKRSAIKEADVDHEIEKIRTALLDADVAIQVVNSFAEKIKVGSIGQEVLRSVTPGQMIIKIVYDQLVELLGGEEKHELNFNAAPPVSIVLAGLQGSGKTTTAAKLANRITQLHKKKVLMASLDVYRPAAQQQLQQLGKKIDVNVLDPIFGEKPIAISNRAIKAGRIEGYDVVILDTAGRLHVDETLMTELQDICHCVNPTETLLVVDSMTGQDAVNLASEFNDKIELSGIALTRVDGDARGGAALSMRAITGKPIKFLGVGESVGDLDTFDAKRIASSILGMGDIVGLVEKAETVVSQEEAEKTTKKLLKGQFTLDDMAEQLGQVKKMGNLEGLINMLPGAKKIKPNLLEANVNEHGIARQEAIIKSMTIAERRNPKILNGSRRRRIAKGSGTTVQDVNRLLKQYKQMLLMFKKAGKKGMKGLFNMTGMPSGELIPPRFN